MRRSGPQIIASSTPRVSIAMPAYNCERFVAAALESLLAQTWGDFELCISDNASTDGTEQICRHYAARDPRIRYTRRSKNNGGPGNFRYVFSLCRGEYHKWSTADDRWDPAYLEKCVAVLDREPEVVLCYSKTQLIDANDKLLSNYEDNLHLVDAAPRARFWQLMTTIGLCNAHLGLIRRSAMLRTRLIGSELQSDVHFLAELSLYGKFWLIPEYLFYRRFHEQSSSWKREDVQHQQHYYDPQHATGPGMHAWRKYIGLVQAVRRCPAPLRAKLGMLGDVSRLALWQRRDLGQELLSVLAGRK